MDLVKLFRTRASQLKRYFLHEDGVCVFDGWAHSEQEFEDAYRKRFGVTGDGNWYIECVS